MFAELFSTRRSAAACTARRALSPRLLRCEPLEVRRLLAAFSDFALSSLLPANGGNGFVINGITDHGGLGYPQGCDVRSLGDVNGDGIDDFFLAAPKSNAYSVPGQRTSSSAKRDWGARLPFLRIWI